MNDDKLMFDIGVLEEQEIEFERVVEEPVVSIATTTKSIPVSAADPVTTAGEVVTTAGEEQEIEFERVVEEPVVSVATTTKSIPVSVVDPV
ncbi:hypothetical protein Tco_0436958, partial [Tanacetum coccineum]